MVRELSEAGYYMRIEDAVLELTDLLAREFTGARPVNLSFTRLDIRSPNNPSNIYGCAVVIGGDVEIAPIVGAVWYDHHKNSVIFPTQNIRRVFHHNRGEYGKLLATFMPCDHNGALGKIHYYVNDDRIKGACEEIAGRISPNMLVVPEFDRVG
jgi:hypothetical protein